MKALAHGLSAWLTVVATAGLAAQERLEVAGPEPSVLRAPWRSPLMGIGVGAKPFLAAGSVLISSMSLIGVKSCAKHAAAAAIVAAIQGPAIGTNTTGQEAQGPHCV